MEMLATLIPHAMPTALALPAPMEKDSAVDNASTVPLYQPTVSPATPTPQPTASNAQQDTTLMQAHAHSAPLVASSAPTPTIAHQQEVATS